MEQKALGLPLSSPELNTAQGDKQTRSSARFKYELDYFFSSTNIKSDLASGQRETERGREEESEKQTARKGGRDEAKFGRSEPLSRVEKVCFSFAAWELGEPTARGRCGTELAYVSLATDAPFLAGFRTRKIQCSLNSSSGGVSQCSC